MIKTKPFHRAKNKKDGLRILITRYYPGGLPRRQFDHWEKELAPSQKLLKRYELNQIDFFGLLKELFLEFKFNPKTHRV